MLAFAILLFLASGQRLDLVDGTYQVRARYWGYAEQIGLHKETAELSASFQVESGSQQVRVALMTREDFDRLRNDAPQSVLAVTPFGAAGGLRFHVRQPGNYVIVLDNRGEPEAAVHLRLTLDFSPTGPDVTELSPRRQLAVVVISFVVFIGIVGWSARKLLKGARHGAGRS